MIAILFAVLAVFDTKLLVRSNDFGPVPSNVGRGEPVRVPCRPAPLKSVTVTPVPEYDALTFGSRFNAKSDSIMPGVTADTLACAIIGNTTMMNNERATMMRDAENVRQTLTAFTSSQYNEQTLTFVNGK